MISRKILEINKSDAVDVVKVILTYNDVFIEEYES